MRLYLDLCLLISALIFMLTQNVFLIKGKLFNPGFIHTARRGRIVITYSTFCQLYSYYLGYHPICKNILEAISIFTVTEDLNNYINLYKCLQNCCQSFKTFVPVWKTSKNADSVACSNYSARYEAVTK